MGALAAGKLHMFLAIDRVSRFTHVGFHEPPAPPQDPPLRSVVAAFPYQTSRPLPQRLARRIRDPCTTEA